MPDHFRSRVAKLTQRHRQVVRLVSLGCTITEIAEILGLSPNTVDNHRLRAMKILGVDRATVLTRVAIKYRISPMGDQLTRTERRKSGRKLIA
jgi:DNA-binding CsgD family transcriptional regulator